jgi:hypothetical protein
VLHEAGQQLPGLLALDGKPVEDEPDKPAGDEPGEPGLPRVPYPLAGVPDGPVPTALLVRAPAYTLN